MENVYDKTIGELEQKGIESKWIKALRVHLHDIGEVSKNFSSINDYLEFLAFKEQPPYEYYSTQYKIIDIVSDAEVLICVWIEKN